MIPRKLVETAFRLGWLLFLPPLVVPVLVFLLVHPTKEFEGEVTAWVAEPQGIDTSSFNQLGNDPESTPAKRQVKVFEDWLSTRSFREAVALQAGLYKEGAPDAEKSAATAKVTANAPWPQSARTSWACSRARPSRRKRRR